MVPQQNGNNCLARGLAIMRLALGYKTAVPKRLADWTGYHAPHEVLDVIRVWFPHHEVIVYCSWEQAAQAQDASCYGGELWGFDSNVWLSGFSYYEHGGVTSHFVVGVPDDADGALSIPLVVTVKMG